jgi:hypothetical protein
MSFLCRAIENVDLLLTCVECNKFVFVCVNALLLMNYFCFALGICTLSQPFYPYSALRMEAATYSDTNILTYQTTRCHNAKAQNVNTDCGQVSLSSTIVQIL